ncbi:Flp pilus assembly protein CpaB [Shewanella woodyi]|uniref:Flp pilus assembly protein CpaB n=1 Tax=Shewanella woodyi TaxID=60961 RepID=UPI0007F8F57D|nr:Flp pilus assembly protein CpaB [Shewanella woodyi]
MSFQKSKSSWLMLLIAIIIAFLAFWLANNYLKNQEAILKQQMNQDGVETISVVVAAQAIQMGETLGGHNMAVANVPATFVSASAVIPDDFEYYEGQVVKHNMSPGEPLLEHYVSGLGIETFSDLLQTGERAVTIEIDEINSVSGMTLPGDIVDLMLVTEVKDNSGALGDSLEEVTQIQPLLQGVRILAVDDISLVSPTQDFVIHGVEGDSMDYGNITVGVKYKDAAKLLLAKDIGDIAFMLRNRNDKKRVAKTVLDNKLLTQEASTQGRYRLYTSSKIENGEIKPVTVAIDTDQPNDYGVSVARFSNVTSAEKN